MGDENLMYKVALSAMTEALETNDPFQESSGGQESGRLASDKSKSIEPKNEVSDRQEMDTSTISEVLTYCRQKAILDSQLEREFQKFLEDKKTLEAKLPFEPWTHIEQLAEEVLSLQSKLESTRFSLAKAREANVILQIENEKWKTQAHQSFTTTDKSDNHAKKDQILRDLEEQLAIKQDECNQLRTQRDGLEKRLHTEVERVKELETLTRSSKAEKDQIERELAQWKRASQSKAKEVGFELQNMTKQVKALQEYKVNASKQIHDLEKELEQRIKATNALEKQLEVLNEQDKFQKSEVCRLTSQIDAQAERERELKLKLDETNLDYRALLKRSEATSQQLREANESLYAMEQARVESYREQEKKLEEALARLDVYREKESQWKSKLEDAELDVRYAKEETRRVEQEAAERISNLEQTLNGMVGNMRALSFKHNKNLNQQPDSATYGTNELDPAKALTFTTGLESEDDVLEDDDDNVITERANRIRMEIHAAAEQVFRQSAGSSREEEEEYSNLHDLPCEQDDSENKTFPATKTPSAGKKGKWKNASITNKVKHNNTRRKKASPYFPTLAKK